MKPLTYFVDLPELVASTLTNLSITSKIALSKALLEQTLWSIQAGEDFYEVLTEEE